MKTKLFTLMLALAVLAVLVSTFPAAPASASDAYQVQFTGKVNSLPATGLIGTWKVAGRTVHVSTRTAIDQTDGRAKVGATVQVEGFRQADGSISATSIDVITYSGW